MVSTLILGELTLQADTDSRSGVFPVTFISSAGNRIGSLYIGEQEWSRLCAAAADLEELRAENARLMSLVGQAMDPPAPVDMRADYLAAHLWLTKHGVAMLKDGKPATLGERAQMLLQLADERGERLERMEPIGALLADWEFVEIDRHDLARDDRLADQVCDALKKVEAATKKGTP